MCPRVAARVEQMSATYHSWSRLKRPNRLVGRGSAMFSAGRLQFMRPTDTVPMKGKPLTNHSDALLAPNPKP